MALLRVMTLQLITNVSSLLDFCWAKEMNRWLVIGLVGSLF